MSTIVCIASGPSLIRADVVLCEQAGLPLLGINNAYQMTDKLNIHYGCDTKWWRAHWDHLYSGPARYSLKRNKKDAGCSGVKQMKQGERRGLSEKWPIICTGGNSGYQAVNLAYLLGFKRIFLLGYDMQNTNRQTHWHDDHKFGGSTNPVNGTFGNWITDFKELAKQIRSKTNIEVINITRRTALTCFPQVSLEDVL